MNILNKITIRRLKMNKKRTIVTIIGIVLSTALICAVAGMVTSFQATLKDRAKQTTGNFHVLINNLSQEDLKYVENNQQIKDYFFVQDIGFSSLENSKNKDKPYLWLREYDEKALRSYGIELIAGRLPNNQNEVILSESIYSNGGVKYKIGDVISLKLGSRVYEDGTFIKDASSTFFQTCDRASREEDCQEEFLEEFDTREVTVVGFMRRPSRLVESYTAPGYTIISKLESPASKMDVAILLKHPRQYREFLEDFATALNQEEVDCFINDELLRYEGVLKDGTMQVLVNVSCVVFMIIIVSSVFVIKNSFTISVTERIREYGMLSSIGATRKQVRKSVLFEGFLLGIIGIPLGILSGILAIAVLLFILNLILGEFIQNLNFVYHVPVFAILFSILLSTMTIYLSCIFPAKKASKIAPIEAIRGNREFIKRRQVKTPRFLKKFFSIGGDIAYKNLKRSRKKYRTTVVSLIVSIVMFLSLTALIDYGFKYTNIYYQKLDYDVSIWLNERSRSQGYSILQELSKFDTVDRFSIVRSFDFEISIADYVGQEVQNLIESDSKEMFVSVVSLGAAEYNQFLRHIGVNPDDYQDKAVLIDQVYLYRNEKYYDVRYLNVGEGDVISGSSYDEQKKYSIEIGKVTKERPMGIQKNSIIPHLVISDQMMDALALDYDAMLYVESDHVEEFVKEVEEVKQQNSSLSNLSVYNVRDEIRANNAIILVISIFLYGFIAVITLIGVTNIFNTITTNMSLRKREFAMFRSVGMTKREFNRMIRLESIFYGLKSLLFGIPIGLLLGYFIYRGIQSNLETAFVIPYFQIGLCIVFVMLIVGITMRYSLKKIHKENIIEVIRNDNI